MNVTDRTSLHKTFVTQGECMRKPLLGCVNIRLLPQFSQMLALAFHRDESKWHAIHHSHHEALPTRGWCANTAGVSFRVLCRAIYPKDVLFKCQDTPKWTCTPANTCREHIFWGLGAPALDCRTARMSLKNLRGFTVLLWGHLNHSIFF